MSELRERAEGVCVRIDRWETDVTSDITPGRHAELVALAQIVAELSAIIEALSKAVKS